MRKGLILLSAAALAFMAQPAIAASPDNPGMDKAMATMADMFKADPLTAEQQARLPLATSVIDKMMPPGTFDEIMGQMFKRVLDPIFSQFGKPSALDVSKNLGVGLDELHLSEAQTIEVSKLIDPAANQRNQALMVGLENSLHKAMTTIEPSMRKGMSEAFAVDFDNQQLGDIQTFFTTDSGSAFAKKFFTMSTDPHVMGAMMKSLPAFMQSLGGMEKDVVAATTNISGPRTWDQLSAAERGRLAQLTGLSQARLKAGMDEAEKGRAAKDKPAD